MTKVGRIINLGSSSHGNSFYIEFKTSQGQKNFLIECGFEYKELLKRMVKNGIDINKINAVLVTHKHSDHSKSIKDFVERGIEVFAPQEVFDFYNIETYQYYVFNEYEKKVLYDTITIVPIPLEHNDTREKVTNYGYLINVENEFNMLFVIDTKYIPQNLSNAKFDVIFIEANYITQNVIFAIKNANKRNDHGNQVRYARLLNSHFSIENVAKTLDGTISSNSKPFDLSKTKAIFLTHISSNKLTNDSFYREFIKNYIDKTRDKTNAHKDLKVVVCLQDGGFLWERK